jgi:5-methylcytosine-specific restriction endonuclease McrA
MAETPQEEPVKREFCGTPKGYRQHRQLFKETACRECKDANAADFRRKYALNPERERARFKKNHSNPVYRKKHEEYVRRRGRKRKAEILHNGHVPWMEQEVLDLYGTICYLCKEEIDLEAPRRVGWGAGWQRGLHFDHVIPVSKGGADAIDNVRPAHAYCNLTKSNKPAPVEEVEPSEDQPSDG